MTLCDCGVDAPPLTLYDCGIFVIAAVIGAIIHKYLCPWRPGSRPTTSQIKYALVQLRPIFYADKVRTGAPYERHREAIKKLNDYIYTEDEHALQWLGEYTAEGVGAVGKGA